MAMAAAAPLDANRPMTANERTVIFASSLGTVFEWYDFYLYGWTAAQIGKAFYSAFDANTQFIFALLTFSAGFLVPPLGALVFGPVDLLCRPDPGLSGDRLAGAGDPDLAAGAAGSCAGRRIWRCRDLRRRTR